MSLPIDRSLIAQQIISLDGKQSNSKLVKPLMWFVSIPQIPVLFLSGVVNIALNPLKANDKIRDKRHSRSDEASLNLAIFKTLTF